MATNLLLCRALWNTVLSRYLLFRKSSGHHFDYFLMAVISEIRIHDGAKARPSLMLVGRRYSSNKQLRWLRQDSPGNNRMPHPQTRTVVTALRYNKEKQGGPAAGPAIFSPHFDVLTSMLPKTGNNGEGVDCHVSAHGCLRT